MHGVGSDAFGQFCADCAGGGAVAQGKLAAMMDLVEVFKTRFHPQPACSPVFRDSAHRVRFRRGRG